MPSRASTRRVTLHRATSARVRGAPATASASRVRACAPMATTASSAVPRRSATACSTSTTCAARASWTMTAPAATAPPRGSTAPRIAAQVVALTSAACATVTPSPWTSPGGAVPP
eukprot:7754326-Pyramimonas_sp.AAC.1